MLNRPHSAETVNVVHLFNGCAHLLLNTCKIWSGQVFGYFWTFRPKGAGWLRNIFFNLIILQLRQKPFHLLFSLGIQILVHHMHTSSWNCHVYKSLVLSCLRTVDTHTHTHIYICTYICGFYCLYVCAGVCLCLLLNDDSLIACFRARENAAQLSHWMFLFIQFLIILQTFKLFLTLVIQLLK